MKQRKPQKLLFTVLLSGVLLAAGCAKEETGKTGAEPGPSQQSKEPRNIHVLLSHANAPYAMKAGADDPYVKEMSKLSGTNLKFEFLGHGGDFTKQMSIRFASAELPDLIRTDSIQSSMHKGALEQGVFTELGPLIDKYAPNLKSKLPKDIWQSPKLSKDGKIYGIPALTAMNTNRVVYIRQDWLDKLGMQQPKTLDDYLKYFEAVKQQDMNGNGDANDEYGFYVRENLDHSLFFFQEFNAHPEVWQMRNGQLTPNIIAPEMKEAIAFWRMLYEKGYINPNLFTNKSADWGAGIRQGKAGSWTHAVTNYNLDWAVDKFADKDKVKLSMIAPPEGPKGKGLMPVTDQIYFVWVIPAKTKNPEEIVKFLDWAWSDKAETFLDFGIKDKTYTEQGGQIQWDPNAPANSADSAYNFYQLSINPRGDGRMETKIVEKSPDAAALKSGMKIAADAGFKHDSLHMPQLESLNTHPELVPGTGSGTLFLEMFAKVVTGKEELDPAFDKFVAEWKKRGGDAAIKEATNWYNTFHKK
jgi:putative aldouronate transport system substrate-binding protein